MALEKIVGKIDERLYDVVCQILRVGTFKDCFINIHSDANDWGISIKYNFNDWGYNTGESIESGLYFSISKYGDKYVIRETHFLMEIDEEKARFIFDRCAELSEKFFKDMDTDRKERREEAVATLYHKNLKFNGNE